MSRQADIKLVMLWESEVRAAGKALAKASETGTQDDWAVAMGACLTALHGVGDEGALVMVASDTIREIARKRKGKQP